MADDISWSSGHHKADILTRRSTGLDLQRRCELRQSTEQRAPLSPPQFPHVCQLFTPSLYCCIQRLPLFWRTCNVNANLQGAFTTTVTRPAVLAGQSGVNQKNDVFRCSTSTCFVRFAFCVFLLRVVSQ